MIEILVVNSGSSSVKISRYQVIDGKLTLLPGKTPSEHLRAIGHRVVHGGTKYQKSTLITPEVICDLKALCELDPLHNPACIKNIEEHMKYNVPQVAVFDTAFHSTLPDYASHYAIPPIAGIKRYGFHGIAHKALWNAYNKKKGRVITLHLGSGCSMAAIKDGVSLDTTMGFTPLEGLMMATRSGDIDPSVVEYLCKKENKTPAEVIHLLNFESGLLGVSGISSKVEVLLQHKECLALDMFCYRIVKTIGAYMAVLGGLDALIFSGGIGENAAEIRKRIIAAMHWFGVTLDVKKNAHVYGMAPGAVSKIHAFFSTVEVYVIGSNENILIAQETNINFLQNN